MTENVFVNVRTIVDNALRDLIFRATVVGATSDSLQIQRPGQAADGQFYPALDFAPFPLVGDEVACVRLGSGVLVLGPIVRPGGSPRHLTLIAGDAQEATLTAAGNLEIAGSHYVVDTDGGAASQDLVTITGGAVSQLLIIQAFDATHTVVVKDAGDLHLDGGDMSLDNDEDTIVLICQGGGRWDELSRSNNGA